MIPFLAAFDLDSESHRNDSTIQEKIDSYHAVWLKFSLRSWPSWRNLFFFSSPLQFEEMLLGVTPDLGKQKWCWQLKEWQATWMTDLVFMYAPIFFQSRSYLRNLNQDWSWNNEQPKQIIKKNSCYNSSASKNNWCSSADHISRGLDIVYAFRDFFNIIGAGIDSAI